MTCLLMFAFGLGGWEMVVILTVLLLLIGGRRLPDLTRGFDEGISQFRKSLDHEAHDAGQSLGGIYGKPAAQALTPDNKTAELYDPAAFQDGKRTGGSRWWRRVLLVIFRVFRPLVMLWLGRKKYTEQ